MQMNLPPSSAASYPEVVIPGGCCRADNVVLGVLQPEKEDDDQDREGCKTPVLNNSSDSGNSFQQNKIIIFATR